MASTVISKKCVTNKNDKMVGKYEKECERRSSNGIADRVNGLGVMAKAVTPELFCGGCSISAIG